MDHRGLVASLPDEQRQRLTEPSDAAGLKHLAVHCGLILGLGALIVWQVPFWPLLMLPQGILIVFLFTLLHEAVHGTPFKSPWLNEAAARVSSFALALPADWFRYFHFAHHRHTQDPDNDPELAGAKPSTLREYIVHVSGIPLWIGQAKTLALNALGRNRDTFVPPKGQVRVRREAQVMIAAYALILAASAYLGAPQPLFAWVIPALLGQPFLRLYLLAEHGRCPFAANMLENSRTTTTTWAVRRLAWNMPYHAEHHAYPAVPFHRLPEFHAIARDYLKVVEPGYAHFHRNYVANLGGTA